MSQLEPTTQAFIDSLAGATPIFTLSPEAARNVLAVAQKSVSVMLAPARSDDRILNVGPKGRTDIRFYRPENAKGTLPVVIYTHGGGKSRHFAVQSPRSSYLRKRTLIVGALRA
jgi:acetyl esterase